MFNKNKLRHLAWCNPFEDTKIIMETNMMISTALDIYIQLKYAYAPIRISSLFDSFH